jgi:lysophospholipase L1-like esterase
MFGDSYFGMMNSARWVYYLVRYGFIDNVMVNAFPGENTAQALVALNNAINYYGKPKYIIWALGMNDGSDASGTEPTNTWLIGVNTVLQICNTYGITPILATIPTVPNINHEGKNNHVRGSGYRYIDFAHAVNAQSDGTWYTGMLSSDNVHPTESGAKALFYQAMIDAPELSYTNP